VRELLPRSIQVFAAVHDTGSINVAAKSVGLTQSAVSRSIKGLEERIGLRLFERTHSGTQPTEAGRIMRRCARWLERDLELIGTEIAAVKSSHGLLLRAGAGPAWSLRWLPRLVPAFNAAYPQVCLSVAIGSGDMLVDQLESGELDIHFGGLTQRLDPRVFRFVQTGVLSIGIFARRDHPCFSARMSASSVLQAFPWMTYSLFREFEGDVLAGYCREMGIAPKPISLDTMSFSTLASTAVQTDHLIFTVSALRPEMEQAGLRILDIQTPNLNWATGITVRRSIGDIPPVTFLIEEASKG
jgi:DNA-binding transcriptional LysR family regulator